MYGVDDASDPHNKVTGILASSAEHIVKVFLSDSSNALPLQPIIGAIQDGVATPESSLFTKPLEGWFVQVSGTMKFAATLVRVRAYLGQVSPHIGTSIGGNSNAIITDSHPRNLKMSYIKYHPR